jgi:hypothetical protein
LAPVAAVLRTLPPLNEPVTQKSAGVQRLLAVGEAKKEPFHWNW